MFRSLMNKSASSSQNKPVVSDELPPEKSKKEEPTKKKKINYFDIPGIVEEIEREQSAPAADDEKEIEDEIAKKIRSAMAEQKTVHIVKEDSSAKVEKPALNPTEVPKKESVVMTQKTTEEIKTDASEAKSEKSVKKESGKKKAAKTDASQFRSIMKAKDLSAAVPEKEESAVKPAVANTQVPVEQPKVAEKPETSELPVPEKKEEFRPAEEKAQVETIKEIKPSESAELPIPEESAEASQTEIAQDETASVSPDSSKPFWRVMTVAVFCAVILGLVGGSFAMPDRERSERENRSLAQFPDINLSSVLSGDFMSRFESYMSDQVIGRDAIVSARSYAERLLGKTESNNVYIGKDGWLFENQTPYEETRVKNTVDAISSFVTASEIKNSLIAIVPDSTYIVKEKLPDLLVLDDQAEQIEKVYAPLKGKMNCLDAVGALTQAEDKTSLYYKNDHHWTTKGAKTVFDAIAKSWELDTSSVHYNTVTLSDSFFGTLASSSGVTGEPDTIEAYVPSDAKGTYIVQDPDAKTKTSSLFDLSKLEQTNQYEVFLGGNVPRLNITTVHESVNKLLIFKDSYANCLIPMLTPYFSEIVVIDARYFTGNIENIVKTEGFSHLLFLYNANTFLEDVSLKDVL